MSWYLFRSGFVLHDSTVLSRVSTSVGPRISLGMSSSDGKISRFPELRILLAVVFVAFGCQRL
jgi:hypothetical protein